MIGSSSRCRVFQREDFNSNKRQTINQTYLEFAVLWLLDQSVRQEKSYSLSEGPTRRYLAISNRTYILVCKTSARKSTPTTTAVCCTLQNFSKPSIAADECAITVRNEQLFRISAHPLTPEPYKFLRILKVSHKQRHAHRLIPSSFFQKELQPYNSPSVSGDAEGVTRPAGLTK